MSTRPPERPGSYREAHSALNWPLLTCGLFTPAAGVAICVALGITVSPQWFAGVLFVLFGLFLVPISLLYRNWPTGIRIDESGISIGATGSAQAASRRPTVNHQSRGLFTCPWPGVQGLRLVTDRAELLQMKNSPNYFTLTNRWGGKAGMTHCNIGVLPSPFRRAALVIEVNPVTVTASQVRPARFYSNFKDGQFSHLVQPLLSPTWVVPTRHPEALSAALQQVITEYGLAPSRNPAWPRPDVTR